MNSSWHLSNAEPSYVLCYSRSREFLLNGSEAVHNEGHLETDKCIGFQYHSPGNGSGLKTKCIIELSGFDFHVHPRLIGVVLASYNRVFVHQQNSDNSQYLSSPADVSFQSFKVSNNNSAFDPNLSSGSFVFLTVDLILKDIRAHFHDSSSVLATLSCPLSKASYFFEGVDSWEVILLSDGLSLASLWSNASWSSPNISDILWGPSLSTIGSTLTIHIKNFRDEAGFLMLETYIKLEHVNCILQPEFLAMVIGFFSLPDWIPQRKEVNVTKEEYLSPVYKFEIRDSFLFLPVESKAFFFLLSLPEIIGSFNPGIGPIEAFESVPSGCWIPQVEAMDILHLVNLSIRGMSLAIILCDQYTIWSITGLHSGGTSVSFLPFFDADIWLTIPQNEQNVTPISIMLNSDSCSLIIEGKFLSSYPL